MQKVIEWLRSLDKGLVACIIQLIKYILSKKRR